MDNRQLPVKRFKRTQFLFLCTIRATFPSPNKILCKTWGDNERSFAGHGRPPQSHSWQEWGETLSWWLKANNEFIPAKNQTEIKQTLFIIHVGLNSICPALWIIKRMESTVSNSPPIFHPITVRVKSFKKQQMCIYFLLSPCWNMVKTNTQTNKKMETVKDICLFCPTRCISRGLSLKRRLRKTYASHVTKIQPKSLGTSFRNNFPSWE